MFKNRKKKAVDNTGQVSYSEGIYGKGDEAKMYFAFRLIPIFFYIMAAAIGVIVIIGIIFNTDVIPLLAIIIPVLSAPLTFMLGYLYGKPVEKNL